MPVLNWIGKEKIVNHDKDVPFRLLRKNKKYSLGNSENLILEGDNLEALKALMPFYYGKIKCIYIDPPYNTGNEKWVYNDKVNSPKIKEWLGKVVGPEGEDLTRHDKWLCMMYPRLKLLYDLLREDGVIFISIDDNEHCYLRQIMDNIFGEENFVNTLATQRRVKSLNVQFKEIKSLNQAFEYILVYKKSKKFSYLNPTKEAGDVRKGGYWNSFWNNADRPTMRYEIDGIKIIKGQWKWSKERALRALENYKIFLANHSEEELKEYHLQYQTSYQAKNGISLEFIKTTKTTVKYWIPPSETTILDTNLMSFYVNDDTGKRKYNFDTVKNWELIKKLVEISTEKSDFILDSFAGSGTTAHAVLDLNKEDGGNRKFILVELEENIAKNITAERVRRVARGYSYKTGTGKVTKVPGLGGGFEYVELGEPLFDKDGMISQAVSFEDMAQYIYFTETRTNLEKKDIKENYLGEFSGNHYFLLFNGIGKNILNRIFLKELNGKDGLKIVYADKCLLDEEVLEKHKIVFKQIPYQIRVY